MKKTSLILGTLTAALLGAAVFVVVTSHSQSNQALVSTEKTQNTIIPTTLPPIDASSFLDRPEFRRVWSNPVKTKSVPGKAIAATVNHHVLATDLLAQLFSSLAKNRPDAKRLVILSPDHFFTGRALVSTHKRTYQTPDGLVKIDTDAIDQLVTQRYATEENGSMYEKEHGIGALIPFIKKTFPQASIVPISIQGTSEQNAALRISQALADLDDGTTLFIISADMSHYLPKAIAQKNDIQTLNWLQNKNELAMAKAKDTHTDSGRQFVALFHWMNQAYPQATFTLIGQGISSDYVNDEQNTTSYLNGIWSTNEKTLR